MYLDKFKIKDQLCEFDIELNEEYIFDYYNSCGINFHDYQYVPSDLPEE